MSELPSDVDRIVRLAIERAEQACRYVLKHNEDRLEAGPYADGFEVACQVCEGAIAEHVRRHIADDIADGREP